MKRTLLIVCLNVLILACVLPLASAKDAPASAEQLRGEVESALKAKNTNAFMALFNWQGVSESMKTELSDENADFFNHDIASVKLIALPADSKLTNEVNGVRYRPNIAVAGMINVEFTQKGNSAQMPYGTKDGRFYLAAMLEEKIGAPMTKEKSLNILVMGSASPDPGMFTGSYVYVKGGKEITETINGKGNRSVAFWGDYVKSCTVHKLTDGEDSLTLIISKNGKRIFESEEVTDKKPIVYEKK